MLTDRVEESKLSKTRFAYQIFDKNIFLLGLDKENNDPSSKKTENKQESFDDLGKTLIP